MIKGIAIVLLRVLAVSYLLNGFHMISWGLAVPAMSDQSEGSSYIFYGSFWLVFGVGLMVFSGPFGRLLAGSELTTPSEPVSEEILIGVGSALLGIYLLVQAVSDLSPLLWQVISHFLSETPNLARNHGASSLPENSIFQGALLQSMIAGMIKAVLGAFLIFNRHAVSRKLRRTTP